MRGAHGRSIVEEFRPYAFWGEAQRVAEVEERIRPAAILRRDPGVGLLVEPLRPAAARVPKQLQVTRRLTKDAHCQDPFGCRGRRFVPDSVKLNRQRDLWGEELLIRY